MALTAVALSALFYIFVFDKSPSKTGAVKKALYCLFILITNYCLGQREDYIWYFGSSGAGLDFNTCPPGVVTGSPAGAWEGSVTISNEATGKLLFYSNGYEVYNADKELMQNGYQAGLSNTMTQNIIIRQPGNDNLYYLFTPDVQGGLVSNTNHPNANGLNYAVIDMSLEGGLGSVVSSFNSLKAPRNCEKLTAVRHSNGQYIWLIGHEYGNNNFFTFLITTAGIDSPCVMTSIGPDIYTHQAGVPGNSNFDAIGELKASRDGHKLAFTTYWNGITALFDFDNTTGAISNPIELKIDKGGYGVSFSPDNSKLYISTIDTIHPSPPDGGQIIQFDISSGEQAKIQDSKAVIYTCNSCGFGSLKIAPDRKIYVARYGEQGNWAGDSYLGVINSPDSPGSSCNYSHDGIYLNGMKGSWGLNNLMEGSNYCTASGIHDCDLGKLNIYPNPSLSNFTISIDGQWSDDGVLSIYDVLGKIIYKQKTKNHVSKVIDTPFVPGIYLLRVQEGDNVCQQKLVIE